MQNMYVKDIMVPIAEYATVRVGDSLLDAVLALEMAQDAYTESKYQHRSVIVMDSEQKAVGKIGQLRVLKAVETRLDLKCDAKNLARFGFSEEYIAKTKEKYRMRGPILTQDALKEAAAKKVEEFMKTPTTDEFIDQNSSIDLAVHRLLAGKHFSLLVTNGEDVVGVLRMADVFVEVFHRMREIVPPEKA